MLNCRSSQVLSAALLFALIATATSLPAGAAAPTGTGDLPEIELSQEVRSQLAQIYAEKRSRTPAQRKMSTAIVYEVRALKGDPEMLNVPRLQPAVGVLSGGRVHVDITAEVTDALLSSIRSLGGTIESSFAQYGAIRAWLPVASIEELAEDSKVFRVREAAEPRTNRINTSQGDVAHRANSARSLLGINGTGVKVGVISDSVDFLAAAQASGDLPSVTVLTGQSGIPASGEGTAMLEIVHDLAPGAQLLFATANGGEANFANNVAQLAAQGCDVIVDDIIYPTEPVFEDGLIADAVAQVAAQGVAYFSSAGNYGRSSFGNEQVWEGDFSSAGTIDFGDTAGTVLAFGGLAFNTLEHAASSVFLQWSDPFGAAASDYDLCLVDAPGSSVLFCSWETQDGAGVPFEGVSCNSGVQCIPAGTRIYVVNYEGTQSARFLHLYSLDSSLGAGTAGQTWGHSAAAGAFSVAAVDVATTGGGPFVGGATNPVETFSSDGPRRIFFNANGSAITPGNFLATGGAVRQKPDIAAADGVATTPPGFNPFFGTSSAAPHAAAIAALMLDANPAATPTQIRQAFAASALDIMAPGVDRDSGYGLIDAVDAVDELLGGGSGCTPGATTACLLNGRFKVEVSWTDFQAVTRAANVAAAGTPDSALFFFGNNVNNWEFLIKAINGCALNNKNWIFFAAATNVGYTVTVTDTQAGGAPKVYTNAVGNLGQAVADINAFNCP